MNYKYDPETNELWLLDDSKLLSHTKFKSIDEAINQILKLVEDLRRIKEKWVK